MGDIGKEFKYAELGRYGYCTNVAFLWGGASLSLSLGQDVYFLREAVKKRRDKDTG